MRAGSGGRLGVRPACGAARRLAGRLRAGGRAGGRSVGPPGLLFDLIAGPWHISRRSVGPARAAVRTGRRPFPACRNAAEQDGGIPHMSVRPPAGARPGTWQGAAPGPVPPPCPSGPSGAAPCSEAAQVAGIERGMAAGGRLSSLRAARRSAARPDGPRRRAAGRPPAYAPRTPGGHNAGPVRQAAAAAKRGAFHLAASGAPRRRQRRRQNAARSIRVDGAGRA